MKTRPLTRRLCCLALACAALMCQPAHTSGRDALARGPFSRHPVPALIFAAATAGNAPTGMATNTPIPADSTRSAPVDSHTRSKAGFMAGAGLAILSLLILATGLALLRAFRHR